MTDSDKERIRALEVQMDNLKTSQDEMKSEMRTGFDKISENLSKLKSPWYTQFMQTLLKSGLYCFTMIVILAAAIKYPHVASALKSKGFIP